MDAELERRDQHREARPHGADGAHGQRRLAHLLNTKRTITGKSSTDTASGVNHYEYRVSTNAGTTWGATVSAASVTLSATGSYVVQFRAVDNVGLASAWAPTVNGAANSACLT